MLNGVGTLFSWLLIKGLTMRVIVQVRFDRNGHKALSTAPLILQQHI